MRSFFFWMLVSSGLGFLKLVVLAQILFRSDFGNYVSIAGVATLSGILFSFGLVESTTKWYPRMWVAGKAPAILIDARSISMTLLWRFTGVTAALSLATLVLPLRYGPMEFTSAGVLGLCAALFALTASILRASDSPKMQQVFSVARSAFSLGSASAGALAFGWRGALAGEAVGGLLTLVAAHSSVRAAFAKVLTGSVGSGEAWSLPKRRTGGRMLYWATVCSSSTSLADRALVNALSGAALAGAYGAVSIIFQIGQLLVNILSQRVGPLIIKAGFTGDESHGSSGSVRWHAVGLGAISLILILVTLGGKAVGFPPGYFAKYSISTASIVVAGLISIVQIYALLEFYLLAHDREDAVLACSLTATAIFVVALILAGMLGSQLEGFLVAVLLARTVHVLTLLCVIRRVRA